MSISITSAMLSLHQMGQYQRYAALATPFSCGALLFMLLLRNHLRMFGHPSVARLQKVPADSMTKNKPSTALKLLDTNTVRLDVQEWEEYMGILLIWEEHTDGMGGTVLIL